MIFWLISSALFSLSMATISSGALAAERKIAEASRETLLVSEKFQGIHTEILAATTFYPAEEYHQDYYKKNPIR